MFRLKYKMHRFINILFYFIFFCIGFLIGLGGAKIEKIFDLFSSFI